MEGTILGLIYDAFRFLFFWIKLGNAKKAGIHLNRIIREEEDGVRRSLSVLILQFVTVIFLIALACALLLVLYQAIFKGALHLK